MKKWILAGALLTTGCPVSSCVARGTSVRTPSGAKRIEDLAVGDELFAVDETTLELVATTVVAIRSAMREVGLIAVAERELRLTSDHPVYCPTEKTYAPAGDWFLGKRTALLTCEGLVEVARVETFVEVVEVFDITVAHDLHNFVANGIVVHNKSFIEECTYNDMRVFDFDSCECANGASGTIDCYSKETCVCATDMGGGDATNSTGNNLLDMSTSDSSLPGDDASLPGDAGDDLGAVDAGADMADVGMSRERGDCVTDDDCAMDTWMCVAVGDDQPGAHYTCQADVVAEPGCATIEAPDECCRHTDCTDDPSGACVIGPIFYCGGVAPMIRNVCLYDECAANADCGAGQICMPPRALGEPVSRCVPSECGTDADCATRAGGECHMFRDPCNGRVRGFFCTYDDSECRTGDDCPEDPNTPGVDYCTPGMMGDGDTFCDSFVPPP